MTNEVTVQGAETGTIYVLRSQSNHPYLAQHRDLIHKIGVTGGEVSLRVSNAKADPTFLLPMSISSLPIGSSTSIGRSWRRFCIGSLLRRGSTSKYPIDSVER